MQFRELVLVAALGGVVATACGTTGGQTGQTAPSTAAPTVSPSTLSKQSPSPSTAQGGDACSFVPKSEAEATLGEPAGEPRPRSSAISSGCAYTSVSGSARLDVAIFRYPDVAAATSKYQEFSNIGQPVPGLGDQARGNTASLAVLKGSVLLTISMPVSPKQADPFEAMKSLARRVIAKL